jgi:hypothetical protein
MSFVRLRPQIFGIVTLGSMDTNLFLRTLQCLPRHFFVDHVKKLCLSVSVTATQAERILSVCSGVTDLAFWVDYLRITPSRSILPLISALPLRRLSIEMEHFIFLFSDPSVNHVWCDGLTHLDIRFWKQTTSPVIPYLDRLHSLTYLALRLHHNLACEASLLSILSSCRALRIMIIYDHPESGEELIWPTDPRVIYLPYPLNVIQDWESQAREDSTCDWFWAEELIQKHMERERLYPFPSFHVVSLVLTELLQGLRQHPRKLLALKLSPNASRYFASDIIGRSSGLSLTHRMYMQPGCASTRGKSRRLKDQSSRAR